MERLELFQNENTPKGNKEDSLLVIYILQILKKYSSPKNPLSSQDVMDLLRKDYSFNNFDEADPKRKEKAAAQQKKVRRLLDTLYESYWGGCIKKEVGKTRTGHRWFYDISRDRFANKEMVIQETLTATEVEFLVDLISATKILNCEGTRGLIDKLLKKTSITKEDRERRLGKIESEAWLKTPNEDLVEKKDLIEECFDECYLTFDYEDEASITAMPIDWHYNDGVCFLYAKVGDEYRKFSLDKIRNYKSDGDSFEALEDFRRYNETDSDKTTLDSLFVNIPTIKNAIANRKCIHFLYRSYAVSNERVVFNDEEKTVLPHSLVFSDGKYYLIGIDESISDLNKIVYFRVDLMFELYYTKTPIEISNWDSYVFDTIERARLVEKHPLMLTGKEVAVTFKVVESALDRVVESFAVKPEEFNVTNETRPIKYPTDVDFHDERVVKVTVKTTKEEAFRWSLSNADVVELVEPQDIRDRIARIADPIYQIYTQYLPDKVRENIDYILKKGIFKITYNVDEDTACQTYKELSKRDKLAEVADIVITGEEICEVGDYLGDFLNSERLCISSSQLKNIPWAARLVNLKTLEFIGVQVADISWMKEMKKLKQIHLLDCSVSDLEVIREHTEIDWLDISGTDVRNLGFIENYKKLNYLNIVACPIEDYSPLLTTKSNLKVLEIDKRALEKIGEDNIRACHIGISIIPRPNTPVWRSLI
jgi:hypothetical protein